MDEQKDTNKKNIRKIQEIGNKYKQSDKKQK